MTNHPETIRPVWFQELLRKAFERKARELMEAGLSEDEALDRSIWFIFKDCENAPLNDVYQYAMGMN